MTAENVKSLVRPMTPADHLAHALNHIEEARDLATRRSNVKALQEIALRVEHFRDVLREGEQS